MCVSSKICEVKLKAHRGHLKWRPEKRVQEQWSFGANKNTKEMRCHMSHKRFARNSLLSAQLGPRNGFGMRTKRTPKQCRVCMYLKHWNDECNTIQYQKVYRRIVFKERHSHRRAEITTPILADVWSFL